MRTMDKNEAVVRLEDLAYEMQAIMRQFIKDPKAGPYDMASQSALQVGQAVKFFKENVR